MRLRHLSARRPRTLRSRLTAGLLVLLVTACLAVALTTAVALRWFLMDRLDALLVDANGRYSVSLEHPGAGEPAADNAGTAPGQSVGTLGVRLISGVPATAAVVRPDGSNQPIILTAGDVQKIASVTPNGAPVSVDLQSLDDYRIIATAGRDGDVHVTGLPLRPVDETLARVAVIELVSFLVIVIAGAIASMSFVRWSLRPLTAVTRVAVEVSDQPLDAGHVDLGDRDLPTDPSTEVGQLGLAVHHMLDHVEASLRARHATEEQLRHFIADASHELRTPVATIRAHAEFARMTPGLPEPVNASLDRIDSESKRMGRLVNDLLLLTRLDAGRPLECTEVDLTRIVVEAVTNARARTPGHGWRLDLPRETVLTQGDPYRLAQVVTNLLTNAATHTPDGTTVSIALHRFDTVDEVTVADDGPGFDASVVSSLFDRFSRADPSRNRSNDNAGLGLAIARGIAHAHGGQLTAERDLDLTTFRVTLPRAPSRPIGGPINDATGVHS